MQEMTGFQREMKNKRGGEKHSQQLKKRFQRKQEGITKQGAQHLRALGTSSPCRTGRRSCESCHEFTPTAPGESSSLYS